MKYIVAVSGGVDSMVLLDTLIREGTHELVVAHFDHGIRPDSHLDAQLVERTAKEYGLVFETKRENLGPTASEDLARTRRYLFLKEVAKKHDGTLVTAHHLDDLVETVAINLIRGTGWRGLAVLDSGVHRPLLDVAKKDILAQAKEYGTRWREDVTNESDVYLRNRLRRRTHALTDDEKRQVRALHAQQKYLRREINAEVQRLIGKGPMYSRYLFTHIPASVAIEGLRAITRGALTRPQLLRLLNAIKVAKPGTQYEAGNGIQIHFDPRHFSL